MTKRLDWSNIDWQGL